MSQLWEPVVRGWLCGVQWRLAVVLADDPPRAGVGTVSRYRVVDAVDDLLGTATFRGGVVRQRGGVFTDADGLAPTSALDALAPHQGGLDATCSNYRHGRLRGARRCPGCGRTRNEVAIDDPPGGRP